MREKEGRREDEGETEGSGDKGQMVDEEKSFYLRIQVHV